MKKLIVVLVSCLFILPVFSQTGDQEFEDAVVRMYENGLTKYETVEQFGAGDWLTREQAAKFFAVFMTTVLEKTEIDNDTACEFYDSDMFDYTLALHIEQACELGLFKGTQNNFLAREPLTKAAALTVLVRALEGQQDESISPWRQNYFNRAQLLGLTKEKDVWALDRPITRYEIALLLYRAANGGMDNEQADMSELGKLLIALGIQDN